MSNDYSTSALVYTGTLAALASVAAATGWVHDRRRHSEGDGYKYRNHFRNQTILFGLIAIACLAAAAIRAIAGA